MKCRPSWSLSTLGSKHACDKNRRSSVTYSFISVFPPHPIPSSRTTKYAAYKTRNIFRLKKSWIVRDGPRSSDCAPDESFRGLFLPLQPQNFLGKFPRKKRPPVRFFCTCFSDLFLSSRPRTYRNGNQPCILLGIWLRPDRLMLRTHTHTKEFPYWNFLTSLEHFTPL